MTMTMTMMTKRWITSGLGLQNGTEFQEKLFVCLHVFTIQAPFWRGRRAMAFPKARQQSANSTLFC